MTSAIAAEALTGVLSTSVVYVHDQVVYLVGGCENTTDSSIHWYLHGLNLADGSDKFTPIDVGKGVYVPSAGGAAGATSGTLPFQAQYQLQRAALLLAANGDIYVAFGVANGSETAFVRYPYHGWLIGYRVTPTLNSTANFAFASTPNYDSSNGTTPCSNVPNYSNTDVSNQCGLGGASGCRERVRPSTTLARPPTSWSAQAMEESWRVVLFPVGAAR